MRIDASLGRWMARILSAGGALVMAACYGPARPEHRSYPVKHVRGTVQMDGKPVARAMVCLQTEPDRCPLTDEEGRFDLRFEADGKNHEICVRPFESGISFQPGCVMVAGDAVSQDVELTVKPVP